MRFLWSGQIMRLWILIAFHLQTTRVFSKKHMASSEESIENLIYYRDCNHKKETTQAPILRQGPQTPPPNDCPFPKMCCSMSCGNDCGAAQNFLGRQMPPMQNPMQPIQPMRMPIQPVQPPVLQRGRKKKMKPIPPIGGRRYSGLTKDRIKSLISQDGDIRKILKDLVRVTMQKVDLLQMINTRRNADPKNDDESVSGEEEDNPA